LRWFCITFSGIIAPEGCHSGGGRGITYRRPERALRKIVWDFNRAKGYATAFVIMDKDNTSEQEHGKPGVLPE